MKKNILFLFLLFSILFKASAYDLDSSLFDNGNVQVGFGASFGNLKAKDYNIKENNFSAFASFGYRLNLTSKFFIDANLNYDIAELSEESYNRGNIGNGYKKVEFEIESFRIFDFNLGYNLYKNLYLFAGLNYYLVSYSYEDIEYNYQVGAGGSSTYSYSENKSEMALGFTLGAIYDIKDTDLFLKFSYSQANYKSPTIANLERSKVEDKRFLLSINYKFKI